MTHLNDDSATVEPADAQNLTAKPRRNAQHLQHRGEIVPPPHAILYSIPEAGALLGISPRGARKMVDTGKLPTVRIGGRVMVRRDTVVSIAANGTEG